MAHHHHEEPDDLYTLRQEFYVGNFRAAIDEGQGLGRSVAPELEAERAEFIYRAQLGLKEYATVLREIKDDPSTPTRLQAVRLLAVYEAQPEGREGVLAQLRSMLDSPASASCPTLQLVAGLVFLKEGQAKEALKACHRGATLEQRALSAMAYLKIDRADHAAKQLALMQEEEEDATLTQLTSAWIGLYQGGSGYRDAQLLFQEMVAKYGPTVTLLNGLGVAHLQQGNYEEADKAFLQALKEDPEKGDADTLINLLATAQHLHKPPETTQRLLAQLQKAAPSHPYVASLATLDSAFDRLQQQYASHITSA